MNKKGFTLVEILAVIVILSLIITIVATNGFGAFNNAKMKINETTENEIKEAAKVFLTDVEYCDEELYDNYPSLFETIIDENSNGDKCDDLQKKVKTSEVCINVKLKQLKELNYVTSKAVDDVLNENINFSIDACLYGNNKTIKLN